MLLISAVLSKATEDIRQAFRGFGITPGTEHKVQGVAHGINGSVEILPDTFDFHIRLLYLPGITGGPEVRATTLV